MKIGKFQIRKSLLVLIVLLGSFVSLFAIPSLAKYKNDTVSKIIQLFTRYNVNYVTTGGKILEPDKFSSYFTLSGLSLPTADDIERTGYDLVGWYTDNTFSGEPITQIETGTVGDKTYYALWAVAQYAITLNVSYDNGTTEVGLPNGWDVVIGRDTDGNDNVIELDSNGQYIVGKGEIVSLRTKYSEDVTISGWEIDEDVFFTERYEEGEQYVYYDFKMPRHAVNLTYGAEFSYIDLSKSSIIFEEDVTISSRQQNGFWYDGNISGMTSLLRDDEKGSFYVWDNTEPLYVTTNGQETQNQIFLVNKTTIYFEDCNLVGTDSYINNANNRKINGVDVNQTSMDGGLTTFTSNIDDLSSYGNIVIDADIHPNYTVNLYFVGDNNTITSIFGKKLYTETNYITSVKFYSADSTKSKVKLGSAFGNFSYTVSNVEIVGVSEDIDDFELLFYSNKGSVTVSNDSIISAPNKSIYAVSSSMSITNSDVEINDILVSTGVTTNGDSYLRCHGYIYGGYIGLNLRDNSSAVIDESIVYNYQHWSSVHISNSTGYLIVKGNRLVVSSLDISNTKIICNSLAIGKSFLAKNTTIVANQIMNNPEKGWTVSNGEFVFTNSGNTALADKNDDNYPFYTYSQASTGDTSFTFGEGNNIYLFGHSKTQDGYYDTSMKAIDSDNPLKEYLDILLDENGDLREIDADGKVVITDQDGVETTVLALDTSEIEESIRNSTNTTSESFILGNSSYDSEGLYREVIISGSNIHAAGNISFYNDTTVDDGYIYSNGNFSSKRNLTISGGEFDTKELGVSYNLTSSNDNGIVTWSKVAIDGGTIKASRIGALSSAPSNNSIVPRGSLSISTDASIVDSPEMYHDVYMNYFYDESSFSNLDAIDNLRFSGIWNNENTALKLDSAVTLTAPIVLSDNEEGSWLLDSLSGSLITNITVDGIAQNSNGDVTTVHDKDYLSLFAIKTSYKIEVKDGSDKYVDFTDGDEQLLDIENVPVGETVALNLSDSAYSDKTVIFYKDSSGIIHNVMPAISNNSISFTMPPSDVQVYITDNLVLNLSDSSYTITATGFKTEIEDLRTDSTFDYSGNIIIEQSELSTVKTSYFSSNSTSRMTGNRLVIASDVNNLTGGRSITIRKVLQYLNGALDLGLQLEDGAKAKILIDGPVQLFRVEVPENSEIVLEGINGTDVDYLALLANGQGTYNNISLGNYSGKTGNITLRNLNIHPYSGRMIGYIGSSTQNTASTIVYDNCLLKFSSWYSSSYLAYNIGTVIIENSILDITAASSWPSPFFKNVTNATIKNSDFTLSKNSSSSSRGSYPLTYGISNKLIIDGSNVTTGLRLSTSTTIYKTVQGVYYSAAEINLVNGASFTTDQRIRTKRIVLNDSSTLNVGSLGDGYLLCSDIEVNDSAVLNAGYVIVSGFYDTKQSSLANEAVTKDDVLAKLNVSSNLLDGTSENGLIINGGTVNVNEFVGGDVFGKVTVNAGILNAKSIGTSGKLYGYGTYVPREITVDGVTTVEDYVYTLSKVPAKGTTVYVKGGTVNVLDNGYLGGMNSTVEITGGVVNLGDSAKVGISEEDKTVLINDFTSQGLTPTDFVSVTISNGEVLGDNGIINTPYGLLNISGSSTGVMVKDVIAENGTVNISNTNSKYSNPLATSSHPLVGVLASNSIVASNINIIDNAVVYGKSVVVNAINATDVASLTVDSTSYLYSEVYGSTGKGTSVITVGNNVVGTRQYSIHYALNDTYADPATNTSPLSYVSGIETVLEEPTRFGYDFDGWYDSNGNKLTSIPADYVGDIELSAKWVAKKVMFRVSIKSSVVGLDTTEFVNEVDLSKGTLNSTNDVFTFTELVGIDYLASYVVAGGINLSNYNLKSYTALTIRIDNDSLNEEQDDINLGSDVVNSEIMKYYLDTGEPIDLTITMIQSK